MRIPIVYIPKTRFKRFLHIEKNFAATREIIPLGFDCHAAYCLQKLHIRTKSYPFDWLYTEPRMALDFINSNITEKFEGFLENLSQNANGSIVSASYPYAEFVHEPNLDTDNAGQEKFRRRIARFIKQLKSTPTDFLFNLPASGINDISSVSIIAESAETFINIIKPEDRFCMYIRYDNSIEENSPLAKILIERLEKLPKISIARYCRDYDRHGIWGHPGKYPGLLADLGITLKVKFPKIYMQ